MVLEFVIGGELFERLVSVVVKKVKVCYEVNGKY